MPSPLAGHAVNPSVEAPWRHPCRQGSRNRQGHRTRRLVGGRMKSCLLRLQVLRRDAEKFAGCFFEPLPLLGLRWKADRTHGDPNNAHHALLATKPPSISTGPCRPTVAGPYAAWMPRKSLHGRTCGVSCDGGPARAPQPSGRSAALQLIHRRRPVLWSTAPKAIS